MRGKCTFFLWSLRTTQKCKKPYPVLCPRVKNMWSSLETTYTAALWPSFSLHNIAHDWEPCQGNRCAKFQPPALQASFHLTAQPPCLFFIDFLPICIRQHAFLVVVFGCFGCLWEKIEFIWALFQVSCDVCLGSDCVFVCVWETESRGTKTPS